MGNYRGLRCSGGSRGGPSAPAEVQLPNRRKASERCRHCCEDWREVGADLCEGRDYDEKNQPGNQGVLDRRRAALVAEKAGDHAALRSISLFTSTISAGGMGKFGKSFGAAQAIF